MWRATLIGTGVVAALGAGLWLGGESLAADRLREALAQSPALAAEAVTPLRRFDAIGLRLDAPALTAQSGTTLTLPWAEIALAPLSPTTARLHLPPEAQLDLAGQRRQLTHAGAEGLLGVAPLRDMAMDSAVVSLRDLQMDGAPLVGGLDLQAVLNRLGHDAPRPARAAYDLRIGLDRLSPTGLQMLGLQPGPLPGDLSAQGDLRLWLDRAPLLGRDAPLPQVVGGRTEGLDLSSGDLTLRVVGRIAADAEGFAEGRVALYTRDGGAIVDHLIALGLVPEGAGLAIRAGLGQIGRAEFPVEAGVAPADAATFPAATDGELRLPLVFRDGRMALGAIPLGPAPRLLP